MTIEHSIDHRIDHRIDHSIDHSIESSAGVGLRTDLAEIRGALARLPFPAHQDDVLATLVRRRAPSRLLWRAGGLSRTRRYHSLDDLCHEIARGDGPGSPPPPGW